MTARRGHGSGGTSGAFASSAWSAQRGTISPGGAATTSVVVGDRGVTTAGSLQSATEQTDAGPVDTDTWALLGDGRHGTCVRCGTRQ
jgi:hypothetical protein